MGLLAAATVPVVPAIAKEKPGTIIKGLPNCKDKPPRCWVMVGTPRVDGAERTTNSPQPPVPPLDASPAPAASVYRPVRGQVPGTSQPAGRTIDGCLYKNGDVGVMHPTDGCPKGTIPVVIVLPN